MAKINPKFQELIPPLDADEFIRLEESIKSEGCRDPIIIWNDIIIDGHNRYLICKKYEIEFKTIQREFENGEDAELWIINNQLSRRNLSKYDRTRLALRCKKLISKKAQERMRDPSRISDEGLKGRTDELLGEIADVGKDTVRDVELIENEATNEEIEKIRKNETSISAVAKKIKDKKKREKTQEIIKKPQEDLTDEERFRKFNIPLFLYNIWNVSKKDTRFGDEIFGWMPPQFAFNLLYYFTNQNEEVSDLFAGGCVMEDVCKAMNRTCKSYDLIPKRKSVILNDLTKNIPDVSNSKLIFLDPPYFSQAKEKYSNLPTDFSNISLKDFYDNFLIIFKELKIKMKKESYLAFIIQGTQWNNNLILEDHAFKIYRMLEDLEFTFVNRIICPYSSEQYNAQQINKSKKEKVILTLYRDLLIFKNQ